MGLDGQALIPLILGKAMLCEPHGYRLYGYVCTVQDKEKAVIMVSETPRYFIIPPL